MYYAMRRVAQKTVSVKFHSRGRGEVCGRVRVRAKP